LMSKLMALGMDLREVAALVTSAPARFLGRSEDIGTLRPGARGDVAILERVEGDFTLEDSEGQMLKAHQRLRPWRTVLGGEIVEPPAGA
jgi:dihydroorotase